MRILIIVLLLIIGTAAAGDNDCEKQAKEFQKENGGYLIFINPIADNGAYIIGPYAGHFINYVYDKLNNEMMYYDPTQRLRMNSISSVESHYTESYGARAVGVWNLNAGEHPPFSLIQRY